MNRDYIEGINLISKLNAITKNLATFYIFKAVYARMNAYLEATAISSMTCFTQALFRTLE